MAIRFTAEGGFLEVPDPPKPPKTKHLCYTIASGPSKTELFDAVKFYPQRKVTFGISQVLSSDPILRVACTIPCEVFVSGIRVLLVPMDPKDKVTIDRIENIWLGEGFIQTHDNFLCVSFNYHVKEHTGQLYLAIEDHQK